MIYTVTPFPTVEYYAKVHSFQQGALLTPDKADVFIGGAGVNISLMLNNLGYPSMTLGFVSGITGAFIEDFLAQLGCTTGFIRVNGNPADCINIRIDTIKPTDIMGKGLSVTKNDIELLYGKLDLLSEGDMLVMMGDLPSGFPKDFYEDILKTFSGRGLNIVSDTDNPSLDKVLENEPFLIRADKKGLEKHFGIELKDHSDAAWYAGKMCEEGAKNVVVYLGAHGTVIVTKDGKALHSPAPKGNVVNTYGAKESLAAGFIAGYFDSEGDIMYAFNMGIAACNATAFSSRIATAEEVRALM